MKNAYLSELSDAQSEDRSQATVCVCVYYCRTLLKFTEDRDRFKVQETPDS
jgi:hypothetical protein